MSLSKPRHRPGRHEQYKAAASATLAAGGARYLVRGCEFAVLEGDWQPSRLVLLEFEDPAAAKRWHESQGYQKVNQVREGRRTCGWSPCRAASSRQRQPLEACGQPCDRVPQYRAVPQGTDYSDLGGVPDQQARDLMVGARAVQVAASTVTVRGGAGMFPAHFGHAASTDTVLVKTLVT